MAKVISLEKPQAAWEWDGCHSWAWFSAERSRGEAHQVAVERNATEAAANIDLGEWSVFVAVIARGEHWEMGSYAMGVIGGSRLK